jgi:hypothetical protein
VWFSKLRVSHAGTGGSGRACSESTSTRTRAPRRAAAGCGGDRLEERGVGEVRGGNEDVVAGARAIEEGHEALADRRVLDEADVRSYFALRLSQR